MEAVEQGDRFGHTRGEPEGQGVGITTSTWGRWAIGLAAEEGTRPSCERKKKAILCFSKNS